MTNQEKNKKSSLKTLLKGFIVIVFLALIVFVLSIAGKNFLRDDIKDKTNFIINNSNVTKDLKADIFVENGVVYVSKADINNFFDNTITYDEQYNQIITCSEKKVASLPIGKNEIEVNSAATKINGSAILLGNEYYVPISELGDIYNIKVTYIEETNIVTADSLDRAYSIATAGKNISIKYKPSSISRTVAKVEQGQTLVIANRSEYPVPDGWTRVRTPNGVLGYAKTKDMGEVNKIRETIEKKAKIEGKISLVWDYYSEYAKAPDRTGTTIQGVNVVAPTSFRVKQAGKGELTSYVGEAGKKYINWAHEKGYQVWPTLSNESMADTTKEILRDYKNREKMINKIVEYIVTYNLDGINIDFENMYENDKSYFSRFLIELEPRLNEIGAVLSVDVTAPDGSPNWSLCYDRYTIGKVADYIIFMGYDQYGVSSNKAGTTAGHDWLEVNITKFLGQEGVPAEKLVLGLPFYTRLWQEKDGKLVKEPGTVSMKRMEASIPTGTQKQWDENLKQYYVEYNKNGSTYKMWIEDETSFTAKLDLVSKYNLAGAAYWMKDMETDNIWNIISSKLFE